MWLAPEDAGYHEELSPCRGYHRLALGLPCAHEMLQWVDQGHGTYWGLEIQRQWRYPTSKELDKTIQLASQISDDSERSVESGNEFNDPFLDPEVMAKHHTILGMRGIGDRNNTRGRNTSRRVPSRHEHIEREMSEDVVASQLAPEGSETGRCCGVCGKRGHNRTYHETAQETSAQRATARRRADRAPATQSRTEGRGSRPASLL
jgi:hypothetical protein